MWIVLHMLVTSDMYRTDVACMQRWGGQRRAGRERGPSLFLRRIGVGIVGSESTFYWCVVDVCSHDMKECRIEPVFESSVRACLPRMTRRMRRITKSCDAGLDIIVYRAPRLKIMLVMLHFKFIFGVRQHGWVLGFSWISFDGGKTVVCH
jgi:hypothetical protein